MRRWIIVAAAAAIALGGCGSGAQSGGAGRSGGHATLLTTLQPPTFDPASIASVGAVEGPLGYAVYDNLFRVDYAAGTVIPRLAESITPDEAATVWTIKLRPGVTFSDGTPLDAGAVKFNWDRIKDNPQLGSGCSTTIEDFKAIDVKGPLELRITLPEPRGSLPQQLFGSGQVRSGTCTNIASPAALKKHGKSYGTSPQTTVGAGPFVLKELVPGSHLTLERNPRYWDAPRPYLDKLTVRQAPDITTSVNAVMSGAAHVASVMAFTPDITRYKQAGFRYHLQPMNGAAMVIFNASRPPLDDPRVRRALTLATDLDDLTKKNFAETVSPSDGWLTRSSLFYDAGRAAQLRQPTNDLAEAQRLIDSYVAEKGGPVTVTVPAAPTAIPTFTTLQQQWRRLKNVQVNIETVTGQVATQRLLANQAQVALNQSGANDPEAMVASFGTGGPQNYLKWSDPQLDAILAKARPETDPARQKAHMVQAAERLVQLNWFIMLYRPGAPTLVAKDLTNVKLHDPSQVDLAQLRFR
ncbi:ABC transporter substrate-binding protein [Actinomadura rugatobispora]|uniref:ABC transporter substrate-binding protein n=1 Tax=Actinomadura rugatobispora TaxID=1994 RepID=A0ABW0ZRF8_9ACTN|nr:ABC transporter substrate-binding protein [Actinomadura rugatobispora]